MDDTFIRVGRGIAVTQPRSRVSDGYTKCSYCDRLVPAGVAFWIQWERIDGFLHDGVKKYCESHKDQLIEIPSAENPHP